MVKRSLSLAKMSVKSCFLMTERISKERIKLVYRAESEYRKRSVVI